MGEAFQEGDLLPLSGLQHLAFCERQCALIHVERQWRENLATAEGRLLHERVDSGKDEARRERRILRGAEIRSLELGLSGKADVVELVRSDPSLDAGRAIALPGVPGRWRPVPVEYKRGRPKRNDCDRIQVCAQAMCLEEMLSVEILRGEIFYAATRRRIAVDLTPELRRKTRESAERFREIVRGGQTPPAIRERKCRSCSLLDVCLPPRRRYRPVAGYLDAPSRNPECGDT